MNHDEEVTWWTILRPVVWLAAVVLVGVTSSTDYGFIVLCTAIPGAIVYSIACVVIEVREKERRAIETFRKDSSIMSFLEGTFADIDHINSISGSSGLRFDYAQIELRPSGSSMKVYTTAEKNRTAFLKQYHDRAGAYYRGEETRSPEQLREELTPYYFKETAEYTPRCPRFFYDLRELNFELTDDGRCGFKLPGFFCTCILESLESSEEIVGKWKIIEIAREAIMKCAKERGYHASYKYLSTDGYKLTIHF